MKPSGEDAAVLELRDVTYRYPGSERPVVTDVSLDIHRGRTVCVLGPSGCGKTTLVKLAASFLLPQTGAVRFVGAPVTRPDPERIVVFQDQDQLFPWKRALENVMFPLRFSGGQRRSGLAGSAPRNRALRALEEVELAEDAHKFPHQLSGGMRQRVALARAFVMEPAVLLLDEPFAAVDAPARERLGGLLQRLQESHNPGALFVTHDVEEALRLGDSLIVLGRDGTVRLRESGWRVSGGSDTVVDSLRRTIRTVMAD